MRLDRKSTRLNSSHLGISYAVFCLKKKKELDLSRAPVPVALGPFFCPLGPPRPRATPRRRGPQAKRFHGPARLPNFFFFFNDTATTEIYTLSLHDALPISASSLLFRPRCHSHRRHGAPRDS